MTAEPGDVWSATIDQNTWRADVVGQNGYRGVLTVIRLSDGLEVLREEVSLSYDAIFGPDVSDVQMWQVMAIEAIDHYNALPGRAPGETGDTDDNDDPR